YWTAAGWAEGPSAWMRESMRGPWLPGGRCLKRLYGSSNAFTAALGFRGRSALGGDALEQGAGRFVGRVLGYELATERLGEDALGQGIDVGAGIGQAGFELVGEGEELIDAVDDLFLLVQVGERNLASADVRLVDAGLIYCVLGVRYEPCAANLATEESHQVFRV